MRLTHFQIFRIALGSYMFVQLSYYWLYAEELFSRRGVFPSVPGELTFPSLLFVFDDPIFVKFFITTLILLSIALIGGFYRRLAAFLLWYGFASLIARDPFVANVSAHYVGWLLLACVLIPKNETERIPRILYVGAWIILCVTYALSGCYKLTNPAWREGYALAVILKSPVGRDFFLTSLILQSESILRFATWGVLVTQILFLPLSMFRQTRWIGWTSMAGMHLANAILTKMTLLSIGILLFHLFTFSVLWWNRLNRFVR